MTVAVVVVTDLSWIVEPLVIKGALESCGKVYLIQLGWAVQIGLEADALIPTAFQVSLSNFMFILYYSGHFVFNLHYTRLLNKHKLLKNEKGNC